MSPRILFGVAAVLAVVGIILLTAASPEQAPPVPTSTSEPSSSSNPPESTRTTRAAEESGQASDEDAAEAPGPTSWDDGRQAQSVPEWDQASVSAATEAAAEVVAAYGSGVQDQQRWWSRLRPLLTEPGRLLYVDVPADQIWPVTITGEITVDTTVSTYLTRATVPTDRGDYLIILVREDGASPWLADRLELPETGTDTR